MSDNSAYMSLSEFLSLTKNLQVGEYCSAVVLIEDFPDWKEHLSTFLPKRVCCSISKEGEFFAHVTAYIYNLEFKIFPNGSMDMYYMLPGNTTLYKY